MNIKEIAYEKSFASHPKSKYWNEKNTCKPCDVFKCSGKKYFFNCDKCSHVFEIALSKIIDNNWCGFCSNKKLCQNNECKICFNKSFAKHSKSIFWSNKNKSKPRDVFIKSNKKYWFDCNKCKHCFEISLDNVFNNRWCSYCSSKQMCNNETCKECFKNSFASHPKSIFWSSKNKESPREIFKCSAKKFWFNCDKCNHDFCSILHNITNGKWCIYCSNTELCNNNCKICFEKSFASQEKSIYWSNKNKINSRDVFKCSGNKYWFDCKECNNDFESKISNIYNGTWCPYCKRKTQIKLLNWLKNNINSKIESEKYFEWTKTKKSYRKFDFYIDDLKLIIELDGPQHFKQISNWKNPEETKIIDDEKNNLALHNCINVIRICQEMVLFDKDDWGIKLLNIIEKVKYSKLPILINIGNMY